MTPRRFDPVAWWGTAVSVPCSVSMMMVEANAIIAMRVLGMGGLWSVTPGERERMVSEKLRAVTRSAQATQRALWQGAGPEAVAAAALAPFRRTTRANMRRLSRRGPKRI